MLLKCLYRSVLAGALLLGGMVPAEVPGVGLSQASAQGKPKPAAAKRFKVQIRSTRPHVINVANGQSARVVASNLRRQGWSVKTKHDRRGYHVVARMLRWKTRAIAPNHGTAIGMSNILRSQGFQVRLVATR